MPPTPPTEFIPSNKTDGYAEGTNPLAYPVFFVRKEKFYDLVSVLRAALGGGVADL